jgi:hypothetical protein
MAVASAAWVEFDPQRTLAGPLSLGDFGDRLAEPEQRTTEQDYAENSDCNELRPHYRESCSRDSGLD